MVFIPPLPETVRNSTELRNLQPKTSESHRTIIKSLAKKRMKFHTYKLKEKVRVVLKNIHYSVNPEETKTETEKLGNMVTNIRKLFCGTETCPKEQGHI
jgi:hypothetical protein